MIFVYKSDQSVSYQLLNKLKKMIFAYKSDQSVYHIRFYVD
jgi:hypothetical protein